MQDRKKFIKHYERQPGCGKILFNNFVNKMQGYKDMPVQIIWLKI